MTEFVHILFTESPSMQISRTDLCRWTALLFPGICLYIFALPLHVLFVYTIRFTLIPPHEGRPHLSLLFAGGCVPRLRVNQSYMRPPRHLVTHLCPPCVKKGGGRSPSGGLSVPAPLSCLCGGTSRSTPRRITIKPYIIHPEIPAKRIKKRTVSRSYYNNVFVYSSPTMVR